MPSHAEFIRSIYCGIASLNSRFPKNNRLDLIQICIDSNNALIHKPERDREMRDKMRTITGNLFSMDELPIFLHSLLQREDGKNAFNAS